MVKREHSVIDLTEDEDGGEPVVQRRRLHEEPDDLICPITGVMFRDPVTLCATGITFERQAVVEWLRTHRTCPATRVRVASDDMCTNFTARKSVERWLRENPDRTPEDWDTREMLPPAHPLPREQLVQRALGGDHTAMRQLYARELRESYRHAPPMEYHRPDLEVLRAWRESCPELRHMWLVDDPGDWEGVTWSHGRVAMLDLAGKCLSGTLPRLEGLTSLQRVCLEDNQLSGQIPERMFEGLTSLKTVSFQNNQLDGSIPAQLFEGLTSLRFVTLDNNQLSGTIPERLFEGLTSLRFVTLNNNQLSGTIPERLFEGLRSLRVVNLTQNQLQLSGPIPWLRTLRSSPQ